MKRFREPAGIRRPWRIWSAMFPFFRFQEKKKLACNLAQNVEMASKFPHEMFSRFFDTSKQAIGALFIHFANVFLSTLTKEDPCSLSVALFFFF